MHKHEEDPLDKRVERAMSVSLCRHFLSSSCGSWIYYVSRLFPIPSFAVESLATGSSVLYMATITSLDSINQRIILR